MNTIRVLDCTLRDGGYCNDWRFGRTNITKIISGLLESGLDIIECGFLTEKEAYSPDRTKFNTIEQIGRLLPEGCSDGRIVAMMNCGDFDVSNLPENDGTLDGIRYAFHKKDVDKAVADCKFIMGKGYKVYMQPMVSLCYSDREFLDLIEKANNLSPYAFYIVDSFGTMKRRDLTRFFYMVEHNLSPVVRIGFHSHNNLQLAYSNAQRLVEIQTNRDIIIDSSVYGMGRGAGNLNTELFLEYLNEAIGSCYSIKPLLHIIDEILDGFYQQNYWGYSLPNYLSAVHNTHPNYALYLSDKKTLPVECMDEIFSLMDSEKIVEYDKSYIESLYKTYQSGRDTLNDNADIFAAAVKGKTVVLIAPGRTSETEKNKIASYCRDSGAVTISINIDYPFMSTDYIFLSNKRRLSVLPEKRRNRCICTTNIAEKGVYLSVPYKDLINTVDDVCDNAGLMAVNLLIKCGVKKVVMAGFDGYSMDLENNYSKQNVISAVNRRMVNRINGGMQIVLSEYAKKISLEFLTESRLNVKQTCL